MRSTRPTVGSSRPIGPAAPSSISRVVLTPLRANSSTTCCGTSRPEGGTSLDAIHRLIAYIAVVFIAVGIAWSVLVAVTGRTAGPGFERFQAAVVSVLFVGSASGALLFASGARPADGLHLLYAFIALALLPLARSFTGRPSGRGTAALLLAAFVVLGAVAHRLLTTG